MALEKDGYCWMSLRAEIAQTGAEMDQKRLIECYEWCLGSDWIEPMYCWRVGKDICIRHKKIEAPKSARFLKTA